MHACCQQIVNIESTCIQYISAYMIPTIAILMSSKLIDINIAGYFDSYERNHGDLPNKYKLNITNIYKNTLIDICNTWTRFNCFTSLWWYGMVGFVCSKQRP